MDSWEELIVGKPTAPFMCALGKKNFSLLLCDPEQSKSLDCL